METLMSENVFLSPAQLGARWGVTKKAIQNRVYAGEALPAISRPLGRAVFLMADVLTYEAAHREEANFG
jgi:hypothetical protein